jgi:hypothetical protein
MTLNERVIPEPRHAGGSCLRVGNAALGSTRWKSRLPTGREFVKYASSCVFLFRNSFKIKHLQKIFCFSIFFLVATPLYSY